MVSSYKVLLINDDADYAISIIQKGISKDLAIEFTKSLDEAIKILSIEKTISAVILDDYGLISKDGDITDAFASNAIMEIRNCRPDILLLCITTEKYNEFNTLRGLGVKIFKRDEGHIDELVKFLRNEIERLPIIRLRSSYKDIFESLDIVYPNSKDQQIFESLLGNIEVKDNEAILKNLFAIRMLIEKGLLNLYSTSPNYSFKEKGSLYKLVDSIPSRHFHDIYKMKIKELYRFCSKIAVHEDKDCLSIPLTQYTNKRCTYELLELIYYMIYTTRN